MRFEQVFLKPGKYKPKGKAEPVDLTRQQIESYVAGTKQMIAAGYKPPVLFAHAPLLSVDGSPREMSDAEKVKNGAGWLVDVKMGGDGSALHVLDITDPQAAQSIQNKSIRFTSPELRKIWKDGKGDVYQNVISHVALTHQPVNAEQAELVAAGVDDSQFAMQFSLDDLEGESDEKPDEGGESKVEEKPEKPENPDLPEKNETAAIADLAQRIEAICAHLEELGISLPEDTKAQEIETILDRILTGLKTAAKIKTKADEDAAAEQANAESTEKPPLVEERGVMQYSLDDADRGRIGNKLLAKVIKAEADGVKSLLDQMVGKNKLTAAARDQLLAVDGVMQFSCDGELVPTLTIAQVVGMLDDCLPEGMALTEDQIASQFSVDDHPDGEQFYSTTPLDGLVPQETLTAEQRASNERLAARNPGLFAASK